MIRRFSLGVLKLLAFHNLELVTRISLMFRTISLRLSLLFYLCLFSSFCVSDWYSESKGIMGTEINVMLWHNDSAKGREAIKAVMDDMEGVNQRLSPYIESSDLSLVNKHAAKAPSKLTDELLFLIDKSLFYSRISEGAFDITFASLGWYYDYRDGKKPSVKKQKELLPAVNYRWLSLNKSDQTLKFTHPDVRLDLGGIAKGYAVDRAIKKLREHGVKNASVSAGGDSRVIGLRNNHPWMIGIKNPRLNGMAGNYDVRQDVSSVPEVKKRLGFPEQKVQDLSVIRLPLTDAAVSTSGDYERFFIDASSGERVHHILNPSTGKSASEVVSVTVIGDKGVDTDPLSTTVFVLGVKNGLALVNRLPGYDAIIIDRFGEVHYSEGLVSPAS